MLNPHHPAPVNARSVTVNRVADVVLGALALAVPERLGAQSCGVPTGVSFGGIDPRTGRNFVFYESYCGGMGATRDGDGADGVSTGTSNAMNIPVEAIEIDYPIRIRRYELAPDTGGSGKFRGGLGIIREYEMLAESSSINVRGDRAKFAPKRRARRAGRRQEQLHVVRCGGAAWSREIPSKYSGADPARRPAARDDAGRRRLRTAGASGRPAPMRMTSAMPRSPRQHDPKAGPDGGIDVPRDPVAAE